MTLKHISQNIVTVKVGPEKHSFSIHEDLLKNRSSYFKAVIDGKFKESKEGVVYLPEDEPKVFEVFVHWLYTQQYLKEIGDGGMLDWDVMVRLYVFADVRGVSKLKNLAISAIIARYSQHDEDYRFRLVRQVPWVYSHTVEDSPLREVLVDLFVGEAVVDFELLEAFRDSPSPEFLIAVTLALGGRVRDPRTWTGPMQRDTCYYHLHEPPIVQANPKGNECPDLVWSDVLLSERFLA